MTVQHRQDYMTEELIYHVLSETKDLFDHRVLPFQLLVMAHIIIPYTGHKN